MHAPRKHENMFLNLLSAPSILMPKTTVLPLHNKLDEHKWYFSYIG